MKGLDTFFCKSAMASLMAMSLICCSSSGNKEKGREPEKTDINTFFHNRINGMKVEWDESEPITLDKVAESQQKVWEQWKDANASYNEEKLLDFGVLDAGRSSKWTLPASLEPNAVMPYYYGYKGEKPADGYPLFLYTHGSGDKDNEWRNGIIFANRFDDAPSVYFIPQIPNTGQYYRWWQRSKQFAWEKMLRLNFLSGNIDPNRVYFFGISEGGYGSQRLASFYADYLAAAGPMAGGEPLKNAPVENCRNTNFSLRTGTEDTGFFRNTLTQYTKDEFDRLESLNPGSFNHWIELIPGAGHHIDYDQTTPWMKQFKRNPYPKTVTWENFEMDGRYRDAFYNLYVKERSNGDPTSRTYYQMTINGNNIDVKVDIVKYTTTEVKSGIEMKFEKSYEPATKGKFVVFLCNELVDLSKEVTLTVNGKQAFKGMVDLDTKNIVNSCGIFYDPQRLYPAAIEVDIAKL